jgi:hypothetical protein
MNPTPKRCFSQQRWDGPDRWCDFYDTLAPPWNTQPEAGTQETIKFWSKHAPDCVKKFTASTQDSYTTWRESFIANVHTVDVPPQQKAAMLRHYLDETNPRIKQVLAVLSTNADGYRDAIDQLETMFGGTSRYVNEQMQKIHALPNIHKGEFIRLEAMVHTLGVYKREMKKIGKPFEYQSAWLFWEVFGKLDPAMSQSFCKWCRTNMVEKDMDTLLAWLDMKCVNQRESYALSQRPKEGQ